MIAVAPAAGSRLSRNDFWLFLTFLALAGCVVQGVFAFSAWVGWQTPAGASAAGSIATLLLLLPFALIGARRCHDRNRSAWLVLLAFPPRSRASGGWRRAANPAWPRAGALCLPWGRFSPC